MQRLVNLIASSMIAAGAAMFVLGVGSVMADELPPPGSLAPDCRGCLTKTKAPQTGEYFPTGIETNPCGVATCKLDSTPGTVGKCGDDNGGCKCTRNDLANTCNCIPES